VPAAVATYLAGRNLPGIIKMAPDPALRSIPWSENTALSVTEGRGEGGDMVSVTAAFAGVAETGTLVLLSGPESPTTLNFLPDTHIVVIDADRVTGTYEQVWADIRAAIGGPLPRTVNWITGPSRTADIEQTLLLGAHGPRRLHIVLVEDRDPGNG
jgi:L-lactate dehydrogenase complex protein LldG